MAQKGLYSIATYDTKYALSACTDRHSMALQRQLLSSVMSSDRYVVSVWSQAAATVIDVSLQLQLSDQLVMRKATAASRY